MLHCRNSMLWNVLVCLFLVLGVCLTYAQDMAQEHKLEFKIIDDETGNPFPELKVETKYYSDYEKPLTEKVYTTDENGLIQILLTEKDPAYLSVAVDVLNYVPMQVTWRSSETQDLIPESYELRLKKGISIGCQIVNEDNEPIEGVTVYLLVPSDSTRERPRIFNYQVTTDETGRWEFNRAPSQMEDIWIRLTHEDYISDSVYGMTPAPSIEQLQAKTGVMVMKRGITVEGTVKDVDGTPIANAVVAQGRDRFGSSFPLTVTDKAGHFEFPQCPLDEMVLTVAAPGWAPDLRSFTVAADIEPVDFQLEPGYTLKVQVVDFEGKPLEGVMIAPDTWRGFRSFTGFDEYYSLSSDSPLFVPQETDKDGNWTWNWAPKDGMEYSILKQGFMDIRNRLLPPTDEIHVITLHSPLQVSGSVVDKDTGEGLKTFDIVSGIVWDDGRVSWDRREVRSGMNGTYSYTFTFPRPEHKLLIEAEGYLPIESRSFTDDEGEVSFDFELERGIGPSGVVLTAEGIPVENAVVYMATPSQPVYLEDGHNSLHIDSLFCRTDDDGQFSFSPQPGEYLLVAVADQGFNQIKGLDIEGPVKMVLSPFASIEGKLLIGDKPGSMEKVSLSYANQVQSGDIQVQFSYRTTTNNDASFRFDRVIPGMVKVNREVKLGAQATGFFPVLNLEVEPGQICHITVGGTGRPVIGKFKPPAETPGINWSEGIHFLQFVQPDIPFPEALKDDQEELATWYENWIVSEEGKAYSTAQRAYPFKVDADGSFRIDDIPEGTYSLSSTFYDGDRFSGAEPVAQVSQEIVVPEMEGGRSLEPLDLGNIDIEMLTRLKVSDKAPGFETATLDGKSLTLAQFKGKFVIVDFWAVWCGPCIGETPYLKEVWERFGEDERFAMVGLSLDPEIEAPRKYIAENDIGWEQGFLGEWSESQIPTEWGVNGIPAIFLVDPEGVIVAKGLRGDGIARAIAEALGE